MELRNEQSSYLQTKRMMQRSYSQHTIQRDRVEHRTQVEGLKKLAYNLKNGYRAKPDVDVKERFKLREKRTVDPRFRRERTRSPKRCDRSQSEQRFGDPLLSSIKLSKDEKIECKMGERMPSMVTIDRAPSARKVLSAKQVPSSAGSSPFERKMSRVSFHNQQQKQLPPFESQQINHVRCETKPISSVITCTKSLKSEQKQVYSNYRRNEETALTTTVTGIEEKSVVMVESTTGSMTKKQKTEWDQNARGRLLLNENLRRLAYWDNDRLMHKYSSFVSPGPRRSNSAITMPLVLECSHPAQSSHKSIEIQKPSTTYDYENVSDKDTVVSTDPTAKTVMQYLTPWKESRHRGVSQSEGKISSV